ncbi:MAG: ferritin-like domain-containing protein [Planctomycetota bacterium]
MLQALRRSLPAACVLVALGCSSTPATRVAQPDAIEVRGESGPELVAGGALYLLCIVGVVVGLVTLPIWLPVVLVCGGKLGFMPPPGRPFRKNGRPCLAPVRAGDEWFVEVKPDVSALSGTEREALSALWLTEARGEHASIAAFSQLSLDLIAVGAPPSLLEGTHKAALDEVVHARLCFAFASAYAGTTLGPAAFPHARAARAFTSRRSLSLAQEIARLAVESLEDGCLDEGFSAAVAAEARDGATDEAVKAALSVIARDEARHEALAWAVVAWCVERGAAGAVLRAGEKLAQPSALAASIEGGRLSAERTRVLYAERRAAVVERARALCAAEATSSPSRGP